ncbi:hypothetical protein B0H17DRAFT_1176369, partial [Mycena rosella]
MSQNMSLEEDLTQMGFAGPVVALRLKIWCTIHLLASFLASPERSPLCAAALAKVTEKLLPRDEDLKSCIRLLRTEHHACLDGLVHFVAVPRTEDQLRRLEARLSVCRCDLSVEVVQLVHDSVNYAAELTFSGMVASIFTTLTAIVQTGLKVGHLAGAQSSALGDGPAMKKWPANTAALFPAGPEASILSFARLFRVTQSPAILHFIRFTLPHCPSLAMPISESNLFWESMVDVLQSAVEKFHEDPVLTDAWQGSNSEDTDEHLQQIIMAFTMFLSTFIATFIESLRRQLTSASSLVTSSRKIHDLLLKVLLLAQPNPNQDALATLCFLVSGMAAV